MNWKEKCTHDGKFHVLTCFGVAHALVMLAVLSVTLVLDETLLVPVAVIGNILFVVHELNGPGDLGDNLDRILDWVLPILVSVLFVLFVGDWYGEQ